MRFPSLAKLANAAKSSINADNSCYAFSMIAELAFYGVIDESDMR